MLGSLRLMKIAAVTLLAMPAAAECLLPDTPPLPEGRVASRDQIMAGVGAVKAYQATLVEYRDCIDGQIKALGTNADDPKGKKGRKARKTRARAKAKLLALYDDSVDLEEALATRLNSQIRDYKAAQK